MADAVQGSQPQTPSKADILFGTSTPAAPAPAVTPAAPAVVPPVASAPVVATAPVTPPVTPATPVEPAATTAPAATPSATPADVPVVPAEPVVPKPGEEKPVETPPAAPVEPAKPADKPKAPDKYELKVEVGAPMTAERLARIEADAKAQGLTNAQAQAVVDSEVKIVKDLVGEHAAKIESWKQQSLADKEIGGPELTRNLELSKRVAEKFGSPTLLKELNDTGFGSHPEVVKMFVRIGKSMGEDRLVISKGAPVGEKRSAADILFGEPTQAATTQT